MSSTLDSLIFGYWRINQLDSYTEIYQTSIEYKDQISIWSGNPITVCIELNWITVSMITIVYYYKIYFLDLYFTNILTCCRFGISSRYNMLSLQLPFSNNSLSGRICLPNLNRNYQHSTLSYTFFFYHRTTFCAALINFEQSSKRSIFYIFSLFLHAILKKNRPFCQLGKTNLFDI